MREIVLTKGYVTIVDDDIYDCISSYKWYYLNGYAVRDISIDGKRKKVRMHRFIYELNNGKVRDDIIVDHINRDSLDNTSENLRAVNKKENNTNKSKRKNSSSKYMGVRKNKQSGNWVAEIRKNGKRVYSESFNDEIASANAYNHHAKLIHGEHVGELNDVPHMSLEEIEKYRCKHGDYKKKLSKNG